VLRLIDGLRRSPGRNGAPSLGMLLISHDLSSLAGIADRVVVLYRGRIVEEGPIQEVFENPQHPYTALLIASAPSVRREHRIVPAQLRRPLDDPNAVPTVDQAAGRQVQAGTAEGCSFAPRCRFATSACEQVPSLEERDGRAVACHARDTWRSQLEPVSSAPVVQSA
jgi:oligopeptide/dipeptide ABC transporter ATP-binding protein